MIRSSMPFDRARSIVDVARELEPSARASYIALMCQRDPDLERRVLALLDQREQAATGTPDH
jgi:hypothetical protein